MARIVLVGLTFLPLSLVLLSLTGTVNIISIEAQSIQAQDYTTLKTPTLPAPSLTFPTEEDLYNYYTQQGTLDYNNIFMNLTSNATGIPSHLLLSTFSNATYLTWLSKSPSNLTEVVIGVSNDGGINFTQPISLNKLNSTGNSSNLHIDAAEQGVFVTWQETDPQTGLSNVFASTSMDAGSSFKTWQLNLNQTTAYDPQVSDNGFAWIQSHIVGGPPCPEDYIFDPTADQCIGPPDILFHRGW